MDNKSILFKEAKWECDPYQDSFGHLYIKEGTNGRFEGSYWITANQTGSLSLQVTDSAFARYQGTWRSNQNQNTGGNVSFSIDAGGRGIRGQWTYTGQANQHNFTGKICPADATFKRSKVWFGVGGITMSATSEVGVVRKTLDGYLYACDKYGNRCDITGAGDGHGFHGGVGSAAFGLFLVSSMYDPRRLSGTLWGATEWAVFIPAGKAAKVLLKAQKYIQLLQRINTLISLYKAGTKIIDRGEWDSIRNNILMMVLESEMPMNMLHPQFDLIELGGELAALSYVYTQVPLRAANVTFEGE